MRSSAVSNGKRAFASSSGCAIGRIVEGAASASVRH
jgi:hypothetical protein